MKCFSPAETEDTILLAVRDGWGVEDNCLYALSIGAIRRDFKKPVTIEEIESCVNNPKDWAKALIPHWQ